MNISDNTQLRGNQHVTKKSRNPILGAIVGDIVGSKYEFNNHKSMDFEFIDEDCFFTDDTVHTLAVYEAMKRSSGIEEFRVNVKKCIIDYTHRYPNQSYGLKFINWMNSSSKEPYGSFGNGSAMRVSCIPYIVEDYGMVREYAKASAEITHNHPEGIKGAVCVASLISLILNNVITKKDIEYLASEYYPQIKVMTVENLRETYKYNETCQDTVPQAIVCFLDGHDFEECVRNAISIGGDSDTLACITGSIAAAFHGVPEDIKRKALSKLDTFLLKSYSI